MNAAADLHPSRTIEQVQSELLDSWRHVCCAEHRFLTLLREFDRRQGWRHDGCADGGDWLNWKCGLARNAAVEKLRVARALEELPQIDEAFRRGDLSYSKVRALTRVATGVSETDLLDVALRASASQLETYCRRLRNGDPRWAAEDALRQHYERSLVRHFREDGSAMISVQLPREEVELIMKALELVGSQLPDDPTRTLFAKAAEALVHLARERLSGQVTGRSAGNEYQVMIHVDASALSGRGGESDVPLPTVRRLTCDGALVPVLVGEDGEPLNIGRRRRSVSTAIKRALLSRDRACCGWPGCTRRHSLQAHHLEHWAEGGETSLSNLVLLCPLHHKLVHEAGFGMTRRPDGRLCCTRPDGRILEQPPAALRGRGDTCSLSRGPFRGKSPASVLATPGTRGRRTNAPPTRILPPGHQAPPPTRTRNATSSKEVSDFSHPNGCKG